MSLSKTSFPKPSPEMIDVLAEHVAPFKTEKRSMFGCPCYFVNGNMFAGVFGDSIFARFSPKDMAVLDMEEKGAFFEPKGRRMKEYRIFTKKMFSITRDIDIWLERSYAYVSLLPPKGDL